MTHSNKSLDASGGSVFLNLLGAAEGALIRAAASTQPLGCFFLEIGTERKSVVLVLFIFVLATFVALGQDKQNTKTPVQILYGPAEPTGKGRGPLSAGVLNMKAI